jgi:hypothetical protein
MNKIKIPKIYVGIKGKWILISNLKPGQMRQTATANVSPKSKIKELPLLCSHLYVP